MSQTANPVGLLMALLTRLVVGPADFVMVSGQMLRGIKGRAERADATHRPPGLRQL
jgi:hypothetical protein